MGHDPAAGPRLAGVRRAVFPTRAAPRAGALLRLPATAVQEAPARTPPEAWEEALLELIAGRIAEGWDEYGAPSAARTPEGPYLATAETPEGPLTVTAESKREAYRKARREWARRLLG